MSMGQFMLASLPSCTICEKTANLLAKEISKTNFMRYIRTKKNTKVGLVCFWSEIMSNKTAHTQQYFKFIIISISSSICIAFSFNKILNIFGRSHKCSADLN